MESLPYPHVDSSLRALAAQAEGFGRSAIGGLHGSVYCVTNLSGIILVVSGLCSVGSFFFIIFFYEVVEIEMLKIWEMCFFLT